MYQQRPQVRHICKTNKAENSTITKGTMCEVSNSQRYKASTLAGTQTHSTEANLPKSLPSCSAWVTVFRWTELKCNTLLTDRGKGERTTGGLPKYGRMEVIFGFL